jgi:hypothetical protein
VHAQAAADETVLRLSLDAKATVAIGPFSRHGQSRVEVKAVDHDFQPEETMTPFGILLPDHDELYLYFTSSKVTSDFIVDCLTDCWQRLQARFPQVTTLLLNQDNGRENHSRRTQFMRRLTQFADQTQLTIELAYYPPYHSKYNPVERVWGVLEQHWNGSLLDSVEAVLNFAQSMTWRSLHPTVQRIHQIYSTGICLTQQAMRTLELRLDRLPGLEKYFVTVHPLPS